MRLAPGPALAARISTTVACALLLTQPASAHAGFTQDAATADRAIPVRDVTIVASTDSGALRTATQIRVLSDGRVIVRDQGSLRLALFDTTLKTRQILADTAAGAPNPYPTNLMGLIPHRGDTTLLADRNAQVLTVIAPDGRFVRAMAPPKPSDMTYLVASALWTSGVDPAGNLIYRGVWMRPPSPQDLQMRMQQRVEADGSNRPTISGAQVDSAPIVRANFDTRTVDTIAMLGLPTSRSITFSPSPGAMISSSAVNPLPLTDDWALMPDGTVAVVRGHDYHVDWYLPNGTVVSSPKMPFAWRRVTHEEKVALLDSLRAADAARRANAPAPPPTPPGAPPRLVIPFVTVEAEELPDYYPPVRAGQVKASPDNHLWILPTTSAQVTGDIFGGAGGRGLVFDVVNRDGVIVERVRLPEQRNLAAIGPNGTVYLTHAAGPGRVVLERARIVR